MMISLPDLEARLGYTFENKSLLVRALTHRSFGANHYERLEFLGDSVLNCVIGEALFLADKHFDEGSLSRVRANLVCEKTLAMIARELNLSEHLRLGAGEVKSGGKNRPSILADVVEAMIGAVMLEAGFEAAKGVVLKLYAHELEVAATAFSEKDAKTQLQELTQSIHIGVPVYELVSVAGAEHAQTFTVACIVEPLAIRTQAQGKSKKIAEQLAAQLAIDAYAEKAHG